jgi:hypothetical protein
VGQPELATALGQSTAEFARIPRDLHIASMRRASPPQQRKTARADGPKVPASVNLRRCHKARGQWRLRKRER